MSIYTATWWLQAKRLIPFKMRKAIHIAWMKVIMSPLQIFHDYIFDVYYPDVIFKTKTNAQIILFEYWLNTYFSTVFRQPPWGAPTAPPHSDIWIEDNYSLLDFNFWYRIDEGYPAQYLYNVAEATPYYFYNESEYMVVYDFTVWVPATLYATSLIQIEAQLDYFKLAGTTYQIISY